MGCMIHKWNGCRCEKCRKIRDKEHDWNGCKCRKCGKTRDEGHIYIYREKTKAVYGVKKSWCEGECRICGNTIYKEHDDQPAGKACLIRCTRCKRTLEKHDFRQVKGRCAEVCSICGEERDYEKIVMSEKEPNDKRIAAFKRLKEAGMIPEELKKNCEKGKHLWDTTEFRPQQFRGGASSVENTCVVCGKTQVEVDWGG